MVAKFDWIKSMTEVIEKKGSIKITKLRKKVVNEFRTLNPETTKSELELNEKFEKKLGKCKKFNISNNVVSCSTNISTNPVPSTSQKLSKTADAVAEAPPKKPTPNAQPKTKAASSREEDEIDDEDEELSEEDVSNF